MDDVKVDYYDGIMEVTLKRGKANAIAKSTSIQLGEIFQNFRDDPSLRVGIITGNGEKFFCAGWDLKGAAEGEEPDGYFGVGGFGGLQELPEMNKPLIAAVNGICCGGGFEIALCCDLIMASPNATFAMPEINVGVFPDAGSIKLHRRLPYNVAMDLLLTGRWMPAEEAHRWGMVRQIVGQDILLSESRKLARLIADGPPLVFQAVKQVVRESMHRSVQDCFDATRDGRFSAVTRCNRSEDSLEGTRAFAEKRKPIWQGK